MAKTLSLQSIEYVLEFERDEPKESQTVFHIRPLNWSERAEVQDGALVTEFNVLGPKNQTQNGLMRHLQGTQTKKVIEYGLEKIVNLHGPNDEVLQFDRKVAKETRETILNSLPAEWVKEIADEIMKISGLTKAEEKN